MGGQWADGTGYPDAITSVFPIESIILALAGGKFLSALRQIFLAVVQGYLSGDISEALFTSHAGERALERGISTDDVQQALQSAKETGNVISQPGKYGTVQDKYIGKNGVTVIIETVGRNAGKIITLWREWGA
jgi:transcriptional/translational regulatory protein YebC/TACO1